MDQKRVHQFWVVAGAVVGAAVIWIVAAFAVHLEGWMAALIVTVFSIAGGVIGRVTMAQDEDTGAGAL